MLNCKPSFCYISPISLLDQIPITSNTHLVLAHLVDQSEEYANFYKQRSELGDYIIQDNSAYELKEPYSPEKLLSLAKQCGAHAIVLPDYPFQHSQKTVDAAIKYAPIYKEAGYQTFFVPQSEVGDLEDWIQAYMWASNNNNIDIIGISILGVPNALPDIDPVFARVVMMQILKERYIFNEHKHHHFLGLNSGPKLEIPSLIRMGVLNTVDSSNPVWTACLGQDYSTNTDSYTALSKPKMPVNFHMPRPKDNLTLNRIQHNIQLTEQLFLNQKQEVWYANE